MEDAVTQIKQKLDIVDVIGSYVSLKKSGRNYKALCPFHNEKTPSFMVSQELQIYKCFGCGVGGDIFNFVEAIEGVDFPRALEILAEKAGVKLVKSKDYDAQSQIKKKIYEINEITTKFYQYMLLKHKVGTRALNYLKKERKLNEDSIKIFRLGYAPDSWNALCGFLRKKGFKEEDLILSGVAVKRSSGNDIIDKFRGRVVFPLINTDNRVLGFTGRTIFDREPKYLNTSETPVFHKSFFIFGLDKNRLNIKKTGAIFVEGQMDVISAYQCGIKNVVCVSGTSLTENQLDILSRYTQDVAFCFDSDFAGIEASYRAIEMAEKKNFNVRAVLIPEPFKDLDDLIKSDANRAKEIIEKPIPIYDFFLTTFLKKYDKRTAIGKKKIMEDLVPIFSKISNRILFDHYVKQISSELEISENTIYSLFKEVPSEREKSYEEFRELEEKSISKIYGLEGHFISLVLKSPIDSAKSAVEKLKKEDFLNEKIAEIFNCLKTYLKDRKTDINIKTFLNKLDEDLKEITSELYLWDFVEEVDSEEGQKVLERELKEVIERIKKDSVRRQLQIISSDIKMAETRKDNEEVERLTKKFEKLSKNLL
jgi:DNA primase